MLFTSKGYYLFLVTKTSSGKRRTTSSPVSQYGGTFITRPFDNVAGLSLF